jgi:hypothetical protein
MKEKKGLGRGLVLCRKVQQQDECGRHYCRALKLSVITGYQDLQLKQEGRLTLVERDDLSDKQLF